MFFGSCCFVHVVERKLGGGVVYARMKVILLCKMIVLEAGGPSLTVLIYVVIIAVKN